jgi:two-component system KDP operon response regulator KdpE
MQLVISLLPAVKKSALRGQVPGRVLVVDPEPLVRWSICVALAAAGFDAESAATAAEARLAVAAGDALRVVLLDVLPDAQPQPLMDEIRAISPNTRFAVLTTARQSSPPPLPDVQVIEKPFDLTRLVSIVTELARASSPPAEDGR